MRRSGRVFPGFALGRQLPRVVDRLGSEFHFPAKLHTSALRGLHSGAGAIGDQRPFKFRWNPDHLPHGAACRRRGIDCLGERMEVNITGAEAAAHYQRAAVVRLLHASEKGGSLGRDSR